MKRIINIFSVACILMLGSCKGYLDPMKNGYYTDENLSQYPSLIKGFVDKAYSLATYNSYLSIQYAYLDCATDNAVLTSPNGAARLLANGQLMSNSDPFETYWNNAYQGIYYVNRFLDKDLGYNTKYLVSEENDKILRKNYKGDAFALRAWFEYNLLVMFGGKSTGDELLGYVIVDKAFDQTQADESGFKRSSYEACVKQIIDDCDSALVYLPYANRDWLATNLNVEGSMRWSRFDQVSIIALKAMTYLQWASPAFNPTGDITRWEKAAMFAALAMDFKIEEDFTHSGVSPYAAYDWCDPNPIESYYSSRAASKSSNYETAQYPIGFRGNATFGPSQDLVDAFPMANGYPITDPASGYDPAKPYEGRDSRFYANIFYNGAKVYRTGSTTDLMYTFNIYQGGKDGVGLNNTSLTGYYLKKNLYLGWNGSDNTVLTVSRSVHHITWRDMCLTFAEAANRAYGPTDSRLGFTAKEALAYLRSRNTVDGKAGIPKDADTYLESCAADQQKFETLVRNERRIELCFEGKRFYDLTRWDIPMEERNQPVHKVEATFESGKFTYDFSQTADTRNLVSPYLPIPMREKIRTTSLAQNKGWEKWQ